MHDLLYVAFIGGMIVGGFIVYILKNKGILN
jgi:hypothetical protein